MLLDPQFNAVGSNSQSDYCIITLPRPLLSSSKVPLAKVDLVLVSLAVWAYCTKRSWLLWNPQHPTLKPLFSTFGRVSGEGLDSLLDCHPLHSLEGAPPCFPIIRYSKFLQGPVRHFSFPRFNPPSLCLVFLNPFHSPSSLSPLSLIPLLLQ